MTSPRAIPAALIDRGPGRPPSSVYVHVPFCRDRCSYCAFTTVADDAVLHAPLVGAVVAEARLVAGVTRLAALDTVYLGGGTPALLSTELVVRLLGELACLWALSADAEITLEANPSNISASSLAEWSRAGINRLSLGVQTFRDDVLTGLGRRHDAAAALQALRLIQSHWQGTWTADLLVGWRGQRRSDLHDDLRQLLEFEPPHISIYGLTIEPGTPLAARAARGIDVTISAQAQANFDADWASMLGEAGYERYEVSNFARPGHRSRHNQVYWANESYVGLGPGASSSVHPFRWTNRPDVAGYIAAAVAGRGLRASAERLDPLAGLLESLSVGLRRHEGLALVDLDTRFSPAWRELLAAANTDTGGASLRDSGLFATNSSRLALSPRARARVDAVTARLVACLSSQDPARAAGLAFAGHAPDVPGAADRLSAAHGAAAAIGPGRSGPLAP